MRAFAWSLTTLGEIHGAQQASQAAHGSLGMKPTMKANTSQASFASMPRRKARVVGHHRRHGQTEAAIGASAGRVCARHEGRLLGNRACLRFEAPTQMVRGGWASRMEIGLNSFQPILSLSHPGSPPQMMSRMTNSNVFDALLREQWPPSARQVRLGIPDGCAPCLFHCCGAYLSQRLVPGPMLEYHRLFRTGRGSTVTRWV